MDQKQHKPKRRTRTVARCTAFAACAVLLLAPLPWPQAALIVPAASPFVGTAASLAARSLGAAAVVCAPVLLLALFQRRGFCRWVCPVGLMTELAGRISPVPARRCRPIPRLGLWLALLSLSAAAAGYPLFLWLDPLALFSGTLGVTFNPASAAAQASVGVLAGVLLLSFLLPGVWCLKLCPLGATQDLLAAPRIWLRRRKNADSDATNDELLAEPMSRRSLLTTAVGATCAVAGVPLGLAARPRDGSENATVLRPPGAAEEWQFGQLCIRCGNCVRSCPSNIITTRWQFDSWSAWLAPEIAFESDYCREDCFACMQVCPSGALRARLSAPKPEIGLAHVLMDRCLLALGRECRTMCLASCPYEAISLHEWTWEDDRRYPIVAQEKCPGCGACQVACTPMDAIVVRPDTRG